MSGWRWQQGETREERLWHAYLAAADRADRRYRVGPGGMAYWEARRLRRRLLAAIRAEYPESLAVSA